jgi:hypothetical protein
LIQSGSGSRIFPQSGSGSTKCLIRIHKMFESGSNADPDPQRKI